MAGSGEGGYVDGPLFSGQIFSISADKFKAIAEPGGVTDNVRLERVTFVDIHPLILSITYSYVVSTMVGNKK